MPVPYRISSQGFLTFENPSESKRMPKIYFHPSAFAKMALLIETQDNEVAWQGLVVRKSPHVYEIEDILVYPQIVSGATVNTDQTPYQMWLMGLNEEVFNKAKMQGHSHVSMKTSPSGVDIRHQAQIVAMLEDGMFYLFMIWNKAFSYHVFLYDASEKLMYSRREVQVDVLSPKSRPTGFTFKRSKVLKHISAHVSQLTDFYVEAVKLIDKGKTHPTDNETVNRSKKPARPRVLDRLFSGKY